MLVDSLIDTMVNTAVDNSDAEKKEREKEQLTFNRDYHRKYEFLNPVSCHDAIVTRYLGCEKSLRLHLCTGLGLRSENCMLSLQ